MVLVGAYLSVYYELCRNPADKKLIERCLAGDRIPGPPYIPIPSLLLGRSSLARNLRPYPPFFQAGLARVVDQHCGIRMSTRSLPG